MSTKSIQPQDPGTTPDGTGNPPLVRKGHQAEIALREPRDPVLAAVMDDLVALEAYGALGGVAEVIRERRRQVEGLAYAAAHDDGHVQGHLVIFAEIRLLDLRVSRTGGTADPASDEQELRQAGALLAAEIDRLNRMMTPPAVTP